MTFLVNLINDNQLDCNSYCENSQIFNKLYCCCLISFSRFASPWIHHFTNIILATYIWLESPHKISNLILLSARLFSILLMNWIFFFQLNVKNSFDYSIIINFFFLINFESCLRASTRCLNIVLLATCIHLHCIDLHSHLLLVNVLSIFMNRYSEYFFPPLYVVFALRIKSLP